MSECTESLFLEDVANHEMTVLLDNGVFRHLRFARTGGHSWLNWFTVTTWPGCLAINGDMGCFVFARLDDMFAFFRSKPSDANGLYINLSYWGEKCLADDRRCGRQCYDEGKFKQAVENDFIQHEFTSKEEKSGCWEAIKNEVLIAENDYQAHDLAGRFEHNGFEFSDFWEHNLKNYTFQYIWCCYAIAWAIRQYDLAHVTEVQP